MGFCRRLFSFYTFVFLGTDFWLDFLGAFSGCRALAFLKNPVFLEVATSFLRSLLQPKKNRGFFCERLVARIRAKSVVRLSIFFVSISVFTEIISLSKSIEKAALFLVFAAAALPDVVVRRLPQAFFYFIDFYCFLKDCFASSLRSAQ
ncbi:hypothetical protein [Flavobacterium sp.]|uniref:hypothetical protein n=1 Tax=Flavobacterium sp. TaxID=239 RepID=UPI0011F6E410|nr:hypothetical protein [Flavobacterium sp.]RZJ73584.1 MAG: hypothetical protein EOO49_01890 [Flavobacterium sp.]